MGSLPLGLYLEPESPTNLFSESWQLCFVRSSNETIRHYESVSA
jgi:hypothetical protein